MQMLLLQWENVSFLYSWYKQFLLLPLEMTSSYPPRLLGVRPPQGDGKLQAAEGSRVPRGKSWRCLPCSEFLLTTVGDVLLRWTSPWFDIAEGISHLHQD